MFLILVATFVTTQVSVILCQVWQHRIVNGQDCSIEEAPYQVGLYLELSGTPGHWSWLGCGGTLMEGAASQVVITAAHCFDDYHRNSLPNNVIVLAGSNQRNTGTKRKIRKILLHEDYRNSIAGDDIAILFLENDYPLSKEIDTAILPSWNFEVDEGNYLVITGWGYDREGGRPHNTLQKLESEVVNTDECREAILPNVMPKNVFCTFAENKGICSGDSGGPVVLKSGTSYILIGIVSVSPGCAEGPDLHVKVLSYLDWIREKLANDLGG